MLFWRGIPLPVHKIEARAANAIGLCKLQLLRDADTASIYSIQHPVFAGLPTCLPREGSCLPPERWMNSNRHRSSSRHSGVAERYRYMARQPVMQLSPGFYAANVSINGQPFLLPATFRPVSCGLCRRATMTCRRHYCSGLG